MPKRGYYEEGYTGTLWKLDVEKFKVITSSPIGSNIYHLGIEIPFGKKPEIISKIKKIRQKNQFHPELIKKIAGFLQKRGSYLVTGFRGVGKSSVVNSSIAEYIYSENKRVESEIKELDQVKNEVKGKVKKEAQIKLKELEKKKLYPIVVSIPMEQTIERLSIIKMIFTEINSHPDIQEHLKNAKKNKNTKKDFEKYNYFSALNKKLQVLEVGTQVETRQFKKPAKQSSDEFFSGIKEIGKRFAREPSIETDQLNIQSTSHLVHDLKDFINLLAQAGNFDAKHFKFVFVFDELDRLKGRDESIIEPSRELSEIYLMELLVSELKVLFTQTEANFIFIAGVDMYEKWQFEKSRGDGLYEGLFSENFYVHSLLTKGPLKVDLASPDSNHNSDSGLNPLLEYQYRNAYGHKYFKNEAAGHSKNQNDSEDKNSEKIKPDLGEDNDAIYTFLKSLFLIEEDDKDGTVKVPGTISHFKKESEDNRRTIMLESFCRYLKYKSRGILRKLIRELNNYIIFVDGDPFISIPENESMKIKFFSGIEKLIESKLPFNYQTNDINKILIYFIIDCSFKFYRDGLNIEDWEAFSILPDQEKVLIDKKIYQDALSILEGNFLEKSFGRKTFYQFTPKYKRTIDYIVMKLPHEQHNFRFTLHDYKELLMDEIQSEGNECISELIHKGKIYGKLDSRFNAIQCFEKAIKCGMAELNNLITSSHLDPIIYQQVLITLDCVCEAYIEMGLIENHVGNNKKAISYFWTGIRTLLEFYEYLLKTDFIKKKDGNKNLMNGSSLGLEFDPWCQMYFPENRAFLENIIDCTFTEGIFKLRKTAETKKIGEAKKSKDIIKEYRKQKEKLFKTIKDEKDFLRLFKNDCKDLIQLLEKNFKDYLNGDKNKGVRFDDLIQSVKSALKTVGFEDTAELSGNLMHLRNFSDCLRIIGFRLKNRKVPIFFTPKLLYCINSLSSIYSKMGQFNFSLSLLKTGLNVSDQTSFNSNAIIQRLQLAMFCLLRSEYINAIRYYRTVFHHLNKEKFFNNQSFYMDNRLLAGIFDMVSIFQNTLYPFGGFKDKSGKPISLDDCISTLLSFSSQTYYLKDKEKRKAIANKLKLIKALQHRALDAFYLVSIQNEFEQIKEKGQNFFSITNHAIQNCKDVLSIGRKDNLGKRVEYSIVRNTGEALMRLGEICLYYGRAQTEFCKFIESALNNPSKDPLFVSPENMKNVKLCFDEQFQKQEEDLKEIWNFVKMGLETPQNYSLLSLVKLSSSGEDRNSTNGNSSELSNTQTNQNEININPFYCLSEKFLRFSDKLLSSFFIPEALTIPQRLGNVYYFVSEDILNKMSWEIYDHNQFNNTESNPPSLRGNDFKKDCLHSAKNYYGSAIKGYKEYKDFDHEEGEWLSSAHSDLGNVYFRLSELNNNVEDRSIVRNLKMEAIAKYKESLRYSVENLDELFAALTGKGSKLNVSLDSLFDTDYAFDILKKFSRRIISISGNAKILADFPFVEGWGFKINTAHVHNLAKFANQCLISALWENQCQMDDKNTDDIKIHHILKQTGYLSNTLRNFGGTIDKSVFKFKENPELKSLNNLINNLKDQKNGEMRNGIWPIGGYRYIVVDYDQVYSEIESFKAEYLRFRGIEKEE